MILRNITQMKQFIGGQVVPQHREIEVPEGTAYNTLSFVRVDKPVKVEVKIKKKKQEVEE